MIPVVVWFLVHGQGIADVDWEVVLSVALGLGAIAVTWIEHRRTSKLDTAADEFRERIAQLEAGLEAARDEAALASDLSIIAERVATIGTATTTAIERLADTVERVAVIEARIDYRPITHTRGKAGRFARPDEGAPAASEPT